jgi:hypothetical protein
VKALITVVLAMSVLMTLSPSPVSAFEAELETYRQALNQICKTGVTPEVVRLYRAARAAIAAARSKSGPQPPRNITVRPPDLAFNDCVQAR